MTNYYKIKRKTYKKSMIQNNNSHVDVDVNSMELNADYDGNKANVDLVVNQNGKRKHVNVDLNNQDLLDLLNIQPLHGALDSRLKRDFGTFRKSAQNQRKTRKRRRVSIRRRRPLVSIRD